MKVEMRRIDPSELEIGRALPWDVYRQGGGGLLARRGMIIANDNQIDTLVDRGLVPPVRNQNTTEVPPSVLRMVNAASRRLQLILGEVALGSAVNANGKMHQLAQVLTTAVDLNPEVALACILHNQKSCPYAVRHCVDTAIVALLVARAMAQTEDDVVSVTLAALTMNVGMLQHQERLQGSREALSDHDKSVIFAHPEAGVALLRQAGIVDQVWLDGVLLHHEAENGSGYPSGRLSADIPLAAKIVSLADRYCARVSSRNYRKSMRPNAALRDILIEGMNPLDRQLTTVFIRELGVYPIGTFVRLESGEIGVVTQKGASSTTPIVDVLLGPRGNQQDVIVRRDTNEILHAIRDVLNESQAAVDFELDQLWGQIAAL